MKKEAFFNPVLKTETFETDIGEITIRELTARDLNDYLDKINEVSNVEIQCFLIVRSVIDDDGALMFKDKDIDKLMGQRASFLTDMTNRILSLNGFEDDPEGN